jgi:hypothetical protein
MIASVLLLGGGIWFAHMRQAHVRSDVAPHAQDTGAGSDAKLPPSTASTPANASTSLQQAFASEQLSQRSVEQLVALFTAAPSAAGLRDVIDTLETKDRAKAVELRILIEAMCSASPDDDPRVAELPNAAAIYVALARFCEGYAATPTSMAHHFGQFEDGYLLKAAKQMIAFREHYGVAAAVEAAQQSAISARDRLDWEAAVLQLRGKSVPGDWTFGADDPELRLNPSGAAAIRQLALELYGCRVFADCNGRPLRWYTHCTRTLQCSPSESYFDVLRNTHTPREFAAAERLAAELMRRRAERGG